MNLWNLVFLLVVFRKFRMKITFNFLNEFRVWISLNMLQSSANFEYQTDTVYNVSQGKGEFDICDTKLILLQSDVEPESKTTVFHDEKPVGAPDEYVTVGTLLVSESHIIKEFKLITLSLSDKIDEMKSSFDEVKSMVTTLEGATKRNSD